MLVRIRAGIGGHGRLLLLLRGKEIHVGRLYSKRNLQYRLRFNIGHTASNERYFLRDLLMMKR